MENKYMDIFNNACIMGWGFSMDRTQQSDVWKGVSTVQHDNFNGKMESHGHMDQKNHGCSEKSHRFTADVSTAILQWVYHSKTVFCRWTLVGWEPHQTGWWIWYPRPYWGDVWMLHVISPVDFLSRSMTRMIPGCNDTHIIWWYSIYLVILMVNYIWLPICMTAPAQYIAHLEFQSATGIHFSIGRRNLQQQAHRFIIVLLATTQFGFSW